MNLIILFPSDFISESQNIAEITDPRRIKHIIETLKKVNAGNTIKCGILNSSIGKGTILELSDKIITVKYSPESNPPVKYPLKLAVAFQRPKTLKKVIQFGTSLGIKEFHVFRSWKVDKSYLSSPIASEEGFFNEALLGLEQACDTAMPLFFRHELFRPFAEDYIGNLDSADFLKITAHPGSESINDLIRRKDLNCDPIQNQKKNILLIIGPEGGFTPFEIELLEKCGSLTVSFGDRILRTETALPYIIGRLDNFFNI